jgi:hypothetical protein
MKTVHFKKIIESHCLLVAIGLLLTQSTHAEGWMYSLDYKNGFSEFAPPSRYEHYEAEKEKEKYEWRSGSSFKGIDRERFDNSRDSRNPWRTGNSHNTNHSFSSQRPWGAVPRAKPDKTNNMRLHDQRFKSWVSRLNDGYQARTYMTGSGLDYGDVYSSPRTNYLPGGFVPFGSNAPMGYGAYPGYYNPYMGYLQGAGFW